MEVACNFLTGFALLGCAAFSFVAFIDCVSFFIDLQGDMLWHFKE